MLIKMGKKYSVLKKMALIVVSIAKILKISNKTLVVIRNNIIIITYILSVILIAVI